MTLFRNLQAFPLTSALTLASPLLALGCSSKSHAVEETANAPVTRVKTGVPISPPPSAPAHESRDWVIPLGMLLMAGSANFIAWRHYKWRGTHEYIMARAAGLTLREDVFRKDMARIGKRLKEAAADGDRRNTGFLTDLTQTAANGFLRPSLGRDDEIREVLKARKRRMPVIRTVIAPSKAGKSRFAEGIAHALTHDREGRHFTDPLYDSGNRLLPDVDPERFLCYRLNLGWLTHPDAEAMSYYLMERVELHIKQRGQCLILIDGAHALFESSNQTVATRVLNLISGWIDQMQGNDGLWTIAFMSDGRYEALVQKDTERWQRYERYDLPILSGKRLEALVWDAAEEGRRRRDVTIPDEALDRALELSLHPKNRTPNPYSVLNLLDNALSETEARAILTRAKLDETFANRHRLSTMEVNAWSIYADVRSLIHKKLSEHLPILNQYGSILNGLADDALDEWKKIERPSGGATMEVSEPFIDATVQGFCNELEKQHRREHGNNGKIMKALEIVRTQDRQARARRDLAAEALPDTEPVKKLDAQPNGH